MKLRWSCHHIAHCYSYTHRGVRLHKIMSRSSGCAPLYYLLYLLITIHTIYCDMDVNLIVIVSNNFILIYLFHVIFMHLSNKTEKITFFFSLFDKRRSTPFSLIEVDTVDNKRCCKCQCTLFKQNSRPMLYNYRLL